MTEMQGTPIPRVVHTPIDPEVNSLPNFVARLRTHFAAWGKGIAPIDSEDAKRLLDIAESTYAPQTPKANIAPVNQD